MSLFIVATPIGNPEDITLRAINVLKSADAVIGEEFKEVSKLLKRLDIQGKELFCLNEHTRENEIKDLLALCAEKNVALVTDCGTPGFCDPGSALVKLAREKGLPVTPVPGVSSIATFLSIAGHRIDRFHFAGFPPAKKEDRQSFLRKQAQSPWPIILMDTPYRLGRLLDDLTPVFVKHRAVLGLDLTQESEQVLTGTLSEIRKKVGDRKAEFLILLLPQN